MSVDLWFVGVFLDHIFDDLSLFYWPFVLVAFQPLFKWLVDRYIFIYCWLKSNPRHLLELLLDLSVSHRLYLLHLLIVELLVPWLHKRIVLVSLSLQLFNFPPFSLLGLQLVLPLLDQYFSDLLLDVPSWLHVASIMNGRHWCFFVRSRQWLLWLLGISALEEGVS